jgi:hypothetical protein
VTAARFLQAVVHLEAPWLPSVQCAQVQQAKIAGTKDYVDLAEGLRSAPQQSTDRSGGQREPSRDQNDATGWRGKSKQAMA